MKSDRGSAEDVRLIALAANLSLSLRRLLQRADVVDLRYYPRHSCIFNPILFYSTAHDEKHVCPARLLPPPRPASLPARPRGLYSRHLERIFRRERCETIEQSWT